MRASGIPAQYVEGTLSQSQAQQLILSMFPASVSDGRLHPGRHADVRPGRTTRSSCPRPRSTTGSSSTPAAACRTPTRSCPARRSARRSRRRPARSPRCPQSLEETTEVQLVAEIYSQADALFGLGDRSVGHDRPRSDVRRRRPGGPAAHDRQLRQQHSIERADLHGDHEHLYALPRHRRRGLSRSRARTRSITGTAVPGSADQLPARQPDPDRAVPERHPERAAGPRRRPISETLVDRIGYAARQGVAPPNVSVNPSGPPSSTPDDLDT